jgi:DNA-binding PadR family transcriptional regulator
MKPLTTTSYAILTLLSLQSWTPYELAKYSQRNVRFIWPRAERKLYEEPKVLVAHGLASVERQLVGRRPRSVYSITDAGREALRSWLDTPTAPPVLEIEALLRVFAAGSGSIDQLLQTIATVRNAANELQRAGAHHADDLVTGRTPFPERLHVHALIFQFLWDYSELLHRWAQWAESAVSGWQDLRPEGKLTWAAQVYGQGSIAHATKATSTPHE